MVPSPSRPPPFRLPRLTVEERRVVGDTGRLLGSLVGSGDVKLDASTDRGSPQSVLLPEAAVRVVVDVLTRVAAGQNLSSNAPALDLESAAGFLGISRPYLTRLLEAGKIPYTVSGGRRQVDLQGLVAYRDKRSARSPAAFDMHDAGLPEPDPEE